MKDRTFLSSLFNNLRTFLKKITKLKLELLETA